MYKDSKSYVFNVPNQTFKFASKQRSPAELTSIYTQRWCMHLNLKLLVHIIRIRWMFHCTIRPDMNIFIRPTIRVK